MWDLTDVCSRTWRSFWFCSQFHSLLFVLHQKSAIQQSFVVCKTVVRLTCYNKFIHMHHVKVKNLDLLLLLLLLAFFPHLRSEDFLKLQILSMCVDMKNGVFAIRCDVTALSARCWFVFYGGSWHRLSRPRRGIIFYFLTFLWILTNGCGATGGKTNCTSSECSSVVSGVSSTAS